MNIETWNNAYGLSKTLLRNFVVGLIMILLAGNIFFATKWVTAVNKLSDYKDMIYVKLEQKSIKMDSVLREVYKQMYEFKIKQYEKEETRKK